jgi:hypothetical protein
VEAEILTVDSGACDPLRTISAVSGFELMGPQMETAR